LGILGEIYLFFNKLDIICENYYFSENYVLFVRFFDLKRKMGIIKIM